MAGRLVFRPEIEKSLMKARTASLSIASRSIRAAAFAAFTLATLPSGPAAAQAFGPTPCSERNTFPANLASKYQEAPVNIGLANTGAVLEVLTSETGS